MYVGHLYVFFGKKSYFIFKKLLFINYNVYFIFERQREREREREEIYGGEAEREGDPESEAGSRLQAVSTEPDVGLELTNSEFLT